MSNKKNRKPSERRRDVPIPPANRIPENVTGQACYEIEELQVASWNPLEDGQGPSTQVHLVVHVRQVPCPLVMRFKGPNTLGQLIAMLERHRNDVWPEGERSAGPSPPPFAIPSDATGSAEKMWERFEALTVPRDAPSDQRQETRRKAFLSGMYGLLSSLALMGEGEDEDAGAAFLARLEEELERSLRQA